MEEKEQVAKLAMQQEEERAYREVMLALRSGLRDAVAEFSFVREAALRSLYKFLTSVSRSDADVSRFSRAQSDPELQLVPILFKHSLLIEPEEKVDQVPDLFDQLFGSAPVKITSPPSDSEIVIALRILGGCCLLHTDSSCVAYKCKALQVLMHLLSTRGDVVKFVCLDSLISLLVHSTESLVDFEKCDGIEEVMTLLRDKQASEQLRLKCGEFLLLLMAQVNGTKGSPMAGIHDHIKRLLGEKPASLIWAASSTLDYEQGLNALHIQAQRVLESLELIVVYDVDDLLAEIAYHSQAIAGDSASADSQLEILERLAELKEGKDVLGLEDYGGEAEVYGRNLPLERRINSS